MDFGYIVQLRLTGRRAVVFGGGPVAGSRVRDLLDAGAEVTVVTPAPGPHVDGFDPRVEVLRRTYEPGDLVGAAIAIATGEDDLDVTALWEESRTTGTLTSVLDDIPHCDFAAPAQVRRGDLRLTVSTGGTAPALAKRLRQHLEEELGVEWADLVDAVGQARDRALPRTVPFAEWARRWEAALADLDRLVALAADGHTGQIQDHILAHVTAPADPADRDQADAPCASATATSKAPA